MLFGANKLLLNGPECNETYSTIGSIYVVNYHTLILFYVINNRKMRGPQIEVSNKLYLRRDSY